MGRVAAEVVRDYNSVRAPGSRHLLCHAPFSNLNFEQNGNVTACCYNRTYVLGRYPEQTIEEIWFGEKAEHLRDLIAQNDLSKGCWDCLELLEGGNYSGTKARSYDDYAQPTSGSLQKLVNRVMGRRAGHYPRVMELELSNVCNLECVMCNGYFSSSIRANREGLPPLECPYDRQFVKQLEQFVPHLTDLKLLGGEPFLIDLYYDILEMVANLRPDIKVHITTNGTVFNNRVRSLLSRLRSPGIVVSIDSVDREGYGKIRVGGKFGAVEENIRSFAAITSAKGTYLTLAVCPMTVNWRGLPQMVRYANDNGFGLHFNTVWRPRELSLHALGHDDLRQVVTYLEGQSFSGSGPLAETNVTRYREMLAGLRARCSENKVRPSAAQQTWDTDELQLHPMSRVAGRILDAIKKAGADGVRSKAALSEVLAEEHAPGFINGYFEVLVNAGGAVDSEKAGLVLSYFNTLDDERLQQVASDIVERGPGNEWQFIEFLNGQDSVTVMMMIRSRYPSP